MTTSLAPYDATRQIQVSRWVNLAPADYHQRATLPNGTTVPDD